MRAGFVMSLVSIRTTTDFWFARVLSASTKATAAFCVNINLLFLVVFFSSAKKEVNSFWHFEPNQLEQ
jgi:hypothetical protein